ncbi:MAG: hypothetical protein ACT4QF_04165 [Sporichthyaceae bacterium]
MSTRPARVALGTVLPLVLIAALVGVIVKLASDRIVVAESCTAVVGETEAKLGLAEAQHASAIVAEAMRRGLSAERTTTALAVAWQEFGLDEPLADPRAIFGAEVGGEEYRDRAAVLTSALTGRSPAAFSCRLRPSSRDSEAAGTSGLTPRAAAALKAAEADLGDQRAGGFDPKGVRSGHMNGSAHYTGRAVDLFFRPVTKANRQTGWATAQWLVANAHRLELATVIYDGKIWTARRSAQGWREYTPPNGNTKNATLMHRDHVHLDVP